MPDRSHLIRLSLCTGLALCATLATPAIAVPALSTSSAHPQHAARHADMAVEHVEALPASAGGKTMVRALVSNRGTVRAPAFTLTVTLPKGATVDGATFPARCAVDPTRRRVVCPFPAGLGGGGRTAVALVPVRIAADIPRTTRLNGGFATVSSNLGDVSRTDHRMAFTLLISPAGASL
ncbi:hypothetical protein EDD99_7955 [Streptomyces sp. 846.5]|nr:hypothetical protein [Streptomyces sp. 846.5]TDT94047.1 hypothetical protein EDD99_7955 [Streptomyces sp. 846.5]